MTLSKKSIKITFLLSYCIMTLFLSLLAIRPTYAQESAQLEFTPNVSISQGFQRGETQKVDETTLGKYVAAWYSLVIGTIGILAAIMIMYGGIRWMTSRGGQAVSEAKDIIFSALIGLVIAFLSYTILNLVNPNLLSLGLQPMEAITYDTNFNLAQPYVDPDTNQPITQKGIQLTGADAGPQKAGESAGDAIARNAEAAVGAPTSNVPGTDGGAKACAYAANEITRNALGQPITNSLSTTAMANALNNNSNFTTISNANQLNLNDLKPGDIIMSASGDSRLSVQTGHAGVYIGNGKIVSNSSSRRRIAQNFTTTSWTNYYGYFDVYRHK